MHNSEYSLNLCLLLGANTTFYEKDNLALRKINMPDFISHIIGIRIVSRCHRKTNNVYNNNLLIIYCLFCFFGTSSLLKKQNRIFRTCGLCAKLSLNNAKCV